MLLKKQCGETETNNHLTLEGATTMRTKVMTIMSMLILGIGAFTYGRARWGVLQPPKPFASGFTIEFAITENGNRLATSTRYVRSSGEFLEDTNYLNPDGSSKRHAKLAGTIDHGAVSIDDAAQKLNYAGHAAIPHQARSVEGLKADPHFVREDSWLGQRVYVTNDCIGSLAGRRCAESWVARDLGGELLRMVILDDGVVVTIKEATSIQFGEPSFVVPDYPVDTAKYQERSKSRATTPMP
jgi:hypothetical protein